jgi:hypothetical protein
MTEIVTMLVRKAVSRTAGPAHSFRYRLIGKEIVVVIEVFDQVITQCLEIGGQPGDVAAFNMWRNLKA